MIAPRDRMAAIRRGIVALALTTIIAPAAGAETLEVPHEFATIAAAMASAADGDTVLVHPRAYPESSFQIPQGVTLLGASGNPEDVVIQTDDYAGVGTAGPHVTVESVTIRGAFGSNRDHYTVRNCMIQSEGRSISFQTHELRILACHFSGPGSCAILGTNIAIEDCSFEMEQGCRLDTINPWSTLTIVSCRFAGSDDWQGLEIEGPMTATITDCRFLDNTVSVSGAGLRILGGTDVTLTNCLFAENSAAGHGGAVYAEDVATLKIDRCTFAENWASTAGAGIALAGNSVATIDRCIISDSIQGEAATCENETQHVTVTRSILYSNWHGDSVCQGGDGWVVSDPLYCGSGDYAVCESSAASASSDANPWGVSIGYTETTCDCPLSLEPTAWSRVKEMFR